MNLFDVKNALETIVQLNQGLSEDKLVTLLRASGWEETNIKEAVMFFRDMTPEITSGAVDGEHLLTGSHPEEGVASSVSASPAAPTPPVIPVEQIAPQASVMPVVPVPVEPPSVTPTEVLQIKQDAPTKEKIDETIKTIESIPLKAKQMQTINAMPEHLPDELPLKPFDSSPHAWTLGDYKDTFHNEEKKPVEVPVPEIFKPKPVSAQMVTPQVEVTPASPAQDEYVEPLSGNDLSLMVLISLLLLVIVLLLGYMYSNGRLVL